MNDSQKALNFILVAFLLMTFFISIGNEMDNEATSAVCDSLRLENAEIRARVDSMYVDWLDARTKHNVFQIKFK
jgi:hypothetical protein